MKTNLLKPLLGLTVSLPLVACTEQKPQQHPNIIFFLVDDYGWADSQVPYGDSVCERHAIFNTPNMVRLAQAGVTLTNAYASPLSTPTRSCILTGVHPAHSGITNYTSPMRDWPTDKIAGNQYAGLDPNDSGEYINPEWTHNSVRPMKKKNGEWVPTGAGQQMLDHSLEAVPLPQILKDNGYYTIHIGKGHWAPMGTPGASPYWMGFDVNVGGGPNGAAKTYHSDRYFGHKIGEEITNYNSVNDLQAYWGTGIDLTQALTIEALRALELPVEKNIPFFLYMSHYGVHNPLQEDPLYYQKYLDKGLPKPVAKYASMVEAVDTSLGDILDWVTEKGIADNTVIVFYADNGGTENKGANHGQNMPLRHGKGACYEGGFREPMIVLWGDRTTAGARVNTPVCAKDVFPTLLEFAGIENPDLIQPIDGQSIVKLVTDGAAYAARNCGVWDWKDPAKLYETTHFTIPESVSGLNPERPIIAHYPHQWEPRVIEEIDFHSSIREGNWKLVYSMLAARLELYNLTDDIGESNDIAAQHPDIVARLAKHLGDQLREWNSPMPTVRATGKKVPMPDELL